jgi:hypothetical protein
MVVSASLLKPWIFLLWATVALTLHAAPLPSFQREIAPLLVERCAGCHGPEKEKGGYRLDTYQRLLNPGDSEQPPIVPGDPDRSHLFQLLTATDPIDRMPQDGEPLSPDAIGIVRRWIAGGAAFDGSDPQQALAELLAGSGFPPPPRNYAFPVPIMALQILGDAEIALGGFREITTWSFEGELRRRISGVPERIHALARQPGSSRLFFAGGTPGRNGAIGVADLEDDSAPEILTRTADELLALALSSTGELLAAGGTDRTIAIFNTVTRERIHQLTAHADWILDLAFSGDGKSIASASRDQTARVFHMEDGAMVSAFREHGNAVTALTFLASDGRVASAGRDGRVRTWEAATGKSIKTSQRWPAEATALLENNGTLWSTWTDGFVRALRVADLKPVQEWGPTDDRVLALALDPERNLPISATHRGEVRFWDESGKEVRSFVAMPSRNLPEAAAAPDSPVP